MPGRTVELGTWYSCDSHGLRVQKGAGVAPLDHKGGNAGRECGCQVFTVTMRWKASRAEVLAALAGEDGSDG